MGKVPGRQVQPPVGRQAMTLPQSSSQWQVGSPGAQSSASAVPSGQVGMARQLVPAAQ